MGWKLKKLVAVVGTIGEEGRRKERRKEWEREVQNEAVFYTKLRDDRVGTIRSGESRWVIAAWQTVLINITIDLKDIQGHTGLNKDKDTL